MATPDLTSGEVMDQAAAALNDPAKTQYTYAKQVPFLNMALGELQEFFELNDVPVVDTVSGALMVVPAGTSEISFTNVGGLFLPSDLIEPSVLWERQHLVNPYTPMTKLNYLPRYMEGVEISQFVYFTWQSNCIRFLPANQINDIKMDYIRNLFTTIPANSTGTEQLAVINAKSFLSYRTAALCAQFLAENPTRAQALDSDAGIALDRSLGIGSKSGQAVMVRHRPFRSSYKRRSYT
jgi:hypothetical protein